MSTGSDLLDLLHRQWSELEPDEVRVYEEWLKGARPHDLHMLVAHVRREARLQHRRSPPTLRGTFSPDER